MGNGKIQGRNVEHIPEIPLRSYNADRIIDNNANRSRTNFKYETLRLCDSGYRRVKLQRVVYRCTNCTVLFDS